MRLAGRSALVTGGAGFIGSELCAALLKSGNRVTCLDNFSSGKMEFIAPFSGDPNFRLRCGDLLRPHDITRALSGCDIVFHFAANPDVRLGATDSRVHFEQNVLATYNLLEAVRESPARELVFASSSVVYGVPKVIPTPESYGPLHPVSHYGASKLACEGLISSYSHNFGIPSVLLRYANIIGRNAHGITRDFKRKLDLNPHELEILGDGTQAKSYLHVSDCVAGTLLAAEKVEHGVTAFNVGSEDQLNVRKIADIVCSEMGLSGVKYRFTGGEAWKGDVKVMLLSVAKLKKLGWKPAMNSEQAVRKAVREMLGKE